MVSVMETFCMFSQTAPEMTAGDGVEDDRIFYCLFLFSGGVLAEYCE